MIQFYYEIEQPKKTPRGGQRGSQIFICPFNFIIKLNKGTPIPY